MELWSWIQSNLDQYLQLHSIPASEDLSPEKKKLLSQWSLELKSFNEDNALPGLTRIRCMVVDEAEAGLTVGFYLKDGRLHTTKYGYPVPSDARFLDSILLKRSLLVCTRVIGEPDLALKSEIYFVPHETLHFPLGSIIDAYGVWRDDEFFMVANALESQTSPSTRDALLQGLSNLLGEKAARWVLHVLLSKISERNYLAGKLVLNVTNSRNSSDLVSFLSAVTRTVYVPLTLDLLNSRSLSPKKNYDTERIEGNLFQLPNHTLLIIDENTLEAGLLNERGLRNVQDIQRLITAQAINYDYTYYIHSLDVDYRVIILSEGKSMFKCDAAVSAEDARSPAVDIESARNFLKGIGPIAKIEESLQEVAQKYFCSRRASGEYSPEQFSRLLSLATYEATSKQKGSVELEDWEVALRMEQGLS